MSTLRFRQEYLSIKGFNDVEISPFTILTGVNGAGKSHLFQAIERGDVIIKGLDNPSVVLFNYETFRLENEGAYSGAQISGERDSGWSFFVQAQAGNIKNMIESRKSNFPSYAKVAHISRAKDIPMWELSSADISDFAAYDQLLTYKSAIEKHFRENQYLKKNSQANAILTLIKKLNCSADEISQKEFISLYKPFNFKNDFLPTELGKIVWDYYVKQRENEVNGFYNIQKGKSLPYLKENDFVQIHGEKPWELINKILEKFGSLHYRINSPEGKHHYYDSYKIELCSLLDEKIKPEFSELSSGERVLMALVASIYKSSSDNHFPNILLLDEIDASLHPSMIQNLLEVIQDIFVKKGVTVLLATHSPTTVALAPDEAIFLVNKTGVDRIQKKPKDEALRILTEGFATLEQGIKLFDQISRSNISLITEGNNSLLIKRAIEFADIKNIEVITGAEGNSGKSQLRILFDFFCKVPHEKKVIFVWDCDVVSYSSLSPENNTFPFVFVVNQKNTIAKKGIENLFPENLFDDYIKTITLSKGETKEEFDDNRKRDFENFIISRNKKEDFENFESLINFLKSI